MFAARRNQTRAAHIVAMLTSLGRHRVQLYEQSFQPLPKLEKLDQALLDAVKEKRVLR